MATLPAPVFCQKRAAKLASNSMSEMPEILVAPLFIETAGFTSTIMMVNELSFSVTAQVVLFDRNGARITSQTVALPAHSREAVLVSMAIAAQRSITGSGASIGQQIGDEFLTIGMAGSGVFRSAGGALVS